MKDVSIRGRLGVCSIYEPIDKSADKLQYPIVLKIDKDDKKEVKRVESLLKKMIDGYKIPSKLKRDIWNRALANKWVDGDTTEHERNHGYMLLYLGCDEKPPVTGKTDGTRFLMEKDKEFQIGESDRVAVVFNYYISGISKKSKAKFKSLMLKYHTICLEEKGEGSLTPTHKVERAKVGAKALGLEVYEEPEDAVDTEAEREFNEALGKKPVKKDLAGDLDEESDDTEDWDEDDLDEEDEKESDKKPVKKTSKKPAKAKKVEEKEAEAEDDDVPW